jgi:hypothetical protein
MSQCLVIAGRACPGLDPGTRNPWIPGQARDDSLTFVIAHFVFVIAHFGFVIAHFGFVIAHFGFVTADSGFVIADSIRNP